MTALSALYARFDGIATGAEKGDSSAVHAAILHRLAANRHSATAEGWSALGLEREGGGGRLRLVGLPPSGSHRAAVPDGVQENR
jgi:hypothetical protein